jgi:two-component system, NarL family, sensor histidine kinase DesK
VSRPAAVAAPPDRGGPAVARRLLAAGDAAAAGTPAAAAPGEWLLPGSRTRRLVLTALLVYFLLVPAITGVYDRVTPSTVFMAAATVIFVGIVGWQVVLPERPGRRGVPWAWLVVMVILAITVFTVGHGGSWLTILAVAAAACGRFTPTTRPATFGAVTCGGTSLIVTLQQSGTINAGNMALQILAPPLGAFFAYTASMVNETVAELRHTRAELARVAVADERLRIARDLHDLLGHSLSLITLKAELSRRMLDTDAASAEQEMAELEQVARQSLSDVRAAVAGYRQPDLAAELGVARQLLTAARIGCQLTTPADLQLPADVDTVLAWTVREGITNVVRHARASQAAVTVAVTADGGGRRVVAQITDDGTGPAAGPAGSGLAGLGERVRKLSGNLMAGPAPGGGFRLQVTIGLEEE